MKLIPLSWASNRSQPLPSDVIAEIRGKGHLILTNGAEGIPNEDMEVLAQLEPPEIWLEVKRALMAFINKEVTEWG